MAKKNLPKSTFMDENRFDAHVDIRRRAEEFLEKERMILRKIKKLEEERSGKKMISTEQLQALREKANLGECIRLIIIAKDIKTRDMANELRITPSYVNAITKNQKVPSVRLITDLLEYFDVSFEQFSYLVDYYNNYTDEAKFEHALYETLKIILEKE